MIDWNGNAIPWATVFKARAEHPADAIVPADYELTPTQRRSVCRFLAGMHDAERNRERAVHEAIHGYYFKGRPYTYMPPRIITYANGSWEIVGASTHPIGGFAVTSDSDGIELLKVILAPSHAAKVCILGQGSEKSKYALDLRYADFVLHSINEDEPRLGNKLRKQAIAELQVEMRNPAVQKMILQEAELVYQKLYG